jgi:hypothetical protein
MLFAQTDLRPGYIITLHDDTVQGLVDYRDNIIMCSRCVFLEAGKTQPVTFSPTDIKAFRFNDSRYFVSKTIDNKSYFFEYLINGKVSIYFARYDQEDHYFVEKDGNGLMELPYEEGVRIKDDKQYFYKSTKHIGILKVYMADAAQLSGKIEELKEPKRKALMLLAEEYHTAVCDGAKCIIYEKKLPPIKINPQITSGFTHFSNQTLNVNDIHFQSYVPTYGVLLHVWLPNVSEKIYLKTGLLGVVDADNQNKFTLFKLPLHVEYLYPKGNIRPRCSIGFSNLIFDPGFSVGLNIKIYKQLNFSVDYDIDFYSKNNKLMIPDTFLSHSLSGGFYVSF